MSTDRSDFRLLQDRLISHVRTRVRNGEITERGLARLSGISQPHIHNVLKGSRFLSAEAADQLLETLRIDLADLLAAGNSSGGISNTPVRGISKPEAGDFRDCRMVPVLDGWIGRQRPFPRAEGLERYPFRAPDLERLEAPVAARFAPDPLRAPVFRGRGVVLLDRSEALRRDPDEESYFALDLSREGAIAKVRRTRGDARLWVCHTDTWQPITISGDPLDAIQGRVCLLVHQL